MSQAESKLSREIAKDIRLEGTFCYKNHGSEFMMAGLPDIVGCHRGRFFGFEVKMPEKRGNTSKAQKRVMALIDSTEGYTAVICSSEEALMHLALLDDLIDQGK